MVKETWIAVSLIIGTVIGAGVLGLPYTFSQSGFLLGTINLIIVGVAVTLMTMYMGEVVLRTSGNLQFTALAEKYLGTNGRVLMFISIFAGMGGAITAYLVGIGISMSGLIGVSPTMGTLLFFIVGALISFYGINAISKSQFVLTVWLIIILSVLCIMILPDVSFENLRYINATKWFYPYGVLLFACLGYSIMPEVRIVLKDKKHLMWRSIVIAMFICLGLYAFFSFSFVGVFGTNVAEIAIDSLSGFLYKLGVVVAILAMATGYLALTMVLKHVLSWDFKVSPILSWGLVSFIPLGIVLTLNPGFVNMLSITGSYAGGLTGILSAFLVKEARKKGDREPEFVVPGGNGLIYATILVFIFGIIYQTIMLI